MERDTPRERLLDAIRTLDRRIYPRCSLLFGPGAQGDNADVFLEAHDATPSAHAHMAIESDKAALLPIARAWAQGCPLLWEAPIGNVGMRPRKESNWLAFAIANGAITHAELCLHVYAPPQKRWKGHKTQAALRPQDASNFLAVLDYFQGPFTSWAHVSHTYGLIPLVARDARDAHLLERLLHGPSGLFGNTVKPLPNGTILAYHAVEPIDMADVLEA